MNSTLDLGDSSASDYLAIRYALVGAFSLYLYEYLLTVGDEVRLVWRSRMSVVKALFFINRYLPFSFIILGVYKPNEADCRKVFTALSLLSATGVVFAESVLALRVYIIWDSSKTILGGLLFLILGGIVGGYYGTVRYIRTAQILNLDLFENGCYVQSVNRTTEAVSYGLILLYEAFVLTLMMVKVVRHRVATSSLMRIAYGDSVAYCSCILLVTLCNLALLKAGSDTLCHLLLLPQATLHNILCNRLLLRLRSANLSLEEEGFLSIHVSDALDSTIILSQIPSSRNSTAQNYSTNNLAR